MATFVSIIGLIGIPVGLYAAVLTFRGAQTVWAWLWLGAFFALDMAAVWAPTEPRRARWSFAVFAVLLAVIGGTRLTRMHSTPLGTLVRLPQNAPSTMLAEGYDEADAALIGLALLSDLGIVRDEESAEARPLLRAAYRRMRADVDFDRVPSPTVLNLVRRQTARTTDTLVFNTAAVQEGGGRARRGVVFLHGLGGAAKLPCWLLARRMPDALVVCPSVGVAGDWTVEDGPTVYEHARRYVEERAATIYVVGLSGGAVGLQHLVQRSALGHIAGVVMVSGQSENDDDFNAVRRSEVPLLFIRGASDTRVRAPRLEGVARHRVRYLEVPGGHHAWLSSEEAVLEAIDEFATPR